MGVWETSGLCHSASSVVGIVRQGRGVKSQALKQTSTHDFGTLTPPLSGSVNVGQLFNLSGSLFVKWG